MARGFSVPTKEPWQTPQQYYAILARKQQAYEDRHNELLGNIDAIRNKLVSIDPKANPEDFQKINTDLLHANKEYQDFIDPTKNPGVFERVKHLVRLGPGAEAPFSSATSGAASELGYDTTKKLYPSQMKQEAEKLRRALGETQSQVAAGPLSPEQQAGMEVRGGEAKRLAMFNADMAFHKSQNPHAYGPDATPEEKQIAEDFRNERMRFYGQGIKPVQPKEQDEYWTPVKGAVPEKLPDGSYRQLGITKSGEYTYKPMPEGYTPQAAQAKPGTSALYVGLDSYAKSHGFGSFNDIPNESRDAVMDYEIRKQAMDKQIPRSHTSTRIMPDANGVPQQVTITDYTTPGGNVQLIDPMPIKQGEAQPAGSSSQPTTPSTPPAQESGNVKVGPSLPFQMKTPAIALAQSELVKATGLDSLAKQVEKKPNDAFNQKRLAVQLERESGGRFTIQALDYVKKLGWGTTLQEWANKPTTGALPPELARQLVDGAHENLIAKQDALKAAMSLAAGGTTPNASGDMITMRLKDGRTGPIHKSQKDKFIRDNPGATEVSGAR